MNALIALIIEISNVISFLFKEGQDDSIVVWLFHPILLEGSSPRLPQQNESDGKKNRAITKEVGGGGGTRTKNSVMASTQAEEK